MNEKFSNGGFTAYQVSKLLKYIIMNGITLTISIDSEKSNEHGNKFHFLLAYSPWQRQCSAYLHLRKENFFRIHIVFWKLSHFIRKAVCLRANAQ